MLLTLILKKPKQHAINIACDDEESPQQRINRYQGKQWRKDTMSSAITWDGLSERRELLVLLSHKIQIQQCRLVKLPTKITFASIIYYHRQLLG